MNFNATRALVKEILLKHLSFKWRVQGFGVLQLYFGKEYRLHVWDSRLRVPNVSLIHDHIQWHFTSLIISGQLTNRRYVEKPVDGTEGELYFMQQIQTGPGGHLMGERMRVRLLQQIPEVYVPGETYSQRNREIHETDPLDGTVTLIERRRTADGDIARVCWREGEWGTAEPRPATVDEVITTCKHALEIYEL